MKQAEMIYKYNYDNRPRFNKELFNRNEDDIIEALKDIILSCQRDSVFTIRVESFEVIDNYDQNNIREDLESTVQFYKHTSVFDNIRMFHVIDVFAYLQIKLFAYKTDYEGIKKKVLTTLDCIISDRKQDLSSVSKIAGKNVTRQNMKELKKLSPKYILGFTK